MSAVRDADRSVGNDTRRGTEPVLGIKIQWPYNSGRRFCPRGLCPMFAAELLPDLDTPAKV